MVFACFADTPLHVLNCVNFVWHDLEHTKGNCDLYIHKQFTGYENMIPELKSSGIFRNVYVCNMPVEHKEGKLWHSIIRMTELFCPRHFLTKWTGRHFPDNEYGVLLMPAPLRFSIALYDVNRKARIWFFEDGSANYFGDILDAYGPSYKHVLKILFNKGHETVVPERMYLNNTTLSASTTVCEMRALPKIDLEEKEFFSLLGRIFGKGNTYEGKRIVYLSIPIYDIKAGDGIDASMLFDETLTALAPYKEKSVIRPHPREDKRDYCGLEVDENRTLWELICASSISDEMILIGSYSTAQFMPKILFNKEPYLVFTYKMYHPDINPQRKKEMEFLIGRLKGMYRDPTRIYDVETIGDYREVLMSFMK